MATTVHPEVLWAQRSSTSDPTRNVVYLTIGAPDVPKDVAKLDLQATKISFEGASKTKGVTYKIEFDFFAEIDVKESKINHTDRDVEFVLRKKEQTEEYWPRLLKEKAKVHWLKTDFDKWVDEDEQDPNDEEDWMNKAGGPPGGGMPGGEGGFEGIDFSKFGAGPGGPGGMDLSALGGLGGLGGMGGPPQGESDDEEEDDDEEMPALEGEEKTPAPAVDAKKATGIEEIE